MSRCPLFVKTMYSKSEGLQANGRGGLLTMGKISVLYLGGIIQERRRRYINSKNNDRIEIVTYIISDDNDKKYYVEYYARSSYRELGTQLLEPVYVKPYKKTVDLSYTICIKKNFDGGRGETFLALSGYTSAPLRNIY